MADKPTNKERLKELGEKIEAGIREVFDSGKYAEYLKVMSRFPTYSVNNQMLIRLQRPNATKVAGYNKWQQFERHVKRGEHGITIIAPTPYKKKIEEQKLDPDTKAPVLDANGKVVMEEKEIEIPTFRPIKVFDYAQTEGKPLPQLAADLFGNVQHYEAFMEALRRTSPVPLTIEPMQDNMDGFFSPTAQRIAIRQGMSEVQTVVVRTTGAGLSIFESRWTVPGCHVVVPVQITDGYQSKWWAASSLRGLIYLLAFIGEGIEIDNRGTWSACQENIYSLYVYCKGAHPHSPTSTINIKQVFSLYSHCTVKEKLT